jgi:hypothetical protein
LVGRLHRHNATANITIFLTPCQYATGQEARVCQSFLGVTAVISPRQTLRTMIRCQYPSGTVFFMGGDPMYAKRFSKKTRSLLLGYTEHSLSNNGFELLVQKSTTMDLMTAELLPEPPEHREGIALLPGSRPEHLEIALPIMLSMSQNHSVVVMLSPFTPLKTQQTLQKNYPTVPFKLLKNTQELASFKFALTIPGTNTMQLATLNIPFMMILPTHNPRILRLNGVLGCLLNIPVMGLALKWLALNIMRRKKRRYALSNQYFNATICPELVGNFSVEWAKDQFDAFIDDPKTHQKCHEAFKTLQRIQNPLDALMDYLGTADSGD